ncbi:MAG TPA: hypothetical protein VGP44_08910 [Gemmatimonadales bacterium]|nr:hypothetical protein [Gemmatimonadales bacterium]
MTGHRVFGGCLESDLDFPELAHAGGMVPTWTLRITDEICDTGPCRFIGEDEVDRDIRVRLYRTGQGYRLQFDDTGDFSVSATGSELEWRPGPNASLEAVRIDVLGRVLPLAMHASGTCCLHGSAVTLGGSGLAFIGLKHQGKSTLALALANAGATLVTDDTLPVSPGSPALMRPGVHSLRLWTDSATRLAGSTTHSGSDKLLVNPPADRVLLAPTRLDAIYLLSPVPQSRPAAVHRQKLSSVDSALTLVRHSKLGPLFGGSESSALLGWAAAVARSVPVYRLEVARDFERLAEVVDRLGEWHGAPPRAARELQGTS